ncbi:MAG: tRNA (5-methylaminomethyl-2-thiouridine)(34)-methyltransferase MnmD [Bacteroidetes bacterium]|nr:tRNA (5-methylaminomethyl-2-thiouridine)(34)-methyltransferase MnmD [Bacteroidota bacterium]MBT6685983.1 tRNA (5-methylaminomethyl-2-thiouridine)(34)-methyltransferase MnmD [Bacteroidota bacterium]MBT7144417.1 tRNA (5-methylaminomethyl-2-thiouridine)(34)-methyltransferase MnmD [Bacteroidota bacterium]MBT7490864.1 tRNA (5-methylaminomethyl-2-thiouridine)(34)-methyltransferase MnmD [Bacteroidota bacterium]
MNKYKIITSDDGSNTIFLPEYNESYHSTFGAIQESMHVFIKSGFLEIEKQEISVFELGFGTGLNTLLTFIEAEKLGKSIDYHAIELFPLKKELVKQLNYCKLLSQECDQIFNKIHEVAWNQSVAISDNFSLTKIIANFENFEFAEKIDLFYFDAFAPEVQPELWTNSIFERVFDNMNKNGILTTYSCKGSVKRALKSAGFQIEKIPGPKGKREILRARKM